MLKALVKGMDFFPKSKKLQEVISNAKKAIEGNSDAIRQEKLAESEIDIEKEELSRKIHHFSDD